MSRRFTEYNRHETKLSEKAHNQGNELFASVPGNETWKRENPFIVCRDTCDEAWEFTWKIALRNHTGRCKIFRSQHFRCVPGCAYSQKRTISCLIVAAVLPRSIISVLRKIRESVSRRTRPPQWQNNDFTLPLTKLYRWSSRSFCQRFLNFLLPNSRLPYSVSPYCFALHFIPLIWILLRS